MLIRKYSTTGRNGKRFIVIIFGEQKDVAMLNSRLSLPLLSLGSSDFESIREQGAVYVDKTDYIFELSRPYTSYFLSRPRRFGKSLLVSTMKSYFEGRKELFEGLKIYEMEASARHPWTRHPTFVFSFASGNYSLGVEALLARLDTQLGELEAEYGIAPGLVSPQYPERLARLIAAAHKATRRRVVVLVDEYDSPLEKCPPEQLGKMREELKGFWGVLKDYQDRLRFVFFTGVTKYQKVSIFSELNNLIELTMDKRYASLCGLTRADIEENYAPHIDALAAGNGMSREECMAEMERRYDGYHFSWPSEGVYNPYSVLSALQNSQFDNYWFRSGTPGTLPRRICREGFDVAGLFAGDVSESRDNLQDMNPGSMALVPLLFQTGYLTLAGPQDEFGRHRLQFPNDEVRTAFTRQLAKLVVPAVDDAGSDVAVNKIAADLAQGDIAMCINRLNAIFASLPYDSGSPNSDPIEANFRNAFYIIFTLLGMAVRVEVAGAKGVCDALVENSAHIYVFEFKRDHTAADAMRQIKERDYAGRFAASPKALHLVAASFSSKEKKIVEWLAE